MQRLAQFSYLCCKIKLSNPYILSSSQYQQLQSALTHFRLGPLSQQAEFDILSDYIYGNFMNSESIIFSPCCILNTSVVSCSCSCIKVLYNIRSFLSYQLLAKTVCDIYNKSALKISKVLLHRMLRNRKLGKTISKFKLSSNQSNQFQLNVNNSKINITHRLHLWKIVFWFILAVLKKFVLNCRIKKSSRKQFSQLNPEI